MLDLGLVGGDGEPPLALSNARLGIFKRDATSLGGVSGRCGLIEVCDEWWCEETVDVLEVCEWACMPTKLGRELALREVGGFIGLALSALRVDMVGAD